MKILFATMPADGHFNPLTGIAVHLQRGGHDVRWYAGPTYQPKLAELGIAALAFQRAREVTGENLATLFPERAKLKGPKLISFDMEQFFVASVTDFYRDIRDIHARFPFDAFFCDAAFYAAKLVAEKIGVPVYSVGVGPLLATSRDVPPPFFGLRPARTVVGGLVHRGVRAMLLSTTRNGARRYNDMLAAEGIAPVDPANWFNLPHESARWYFQNGVPGMDYPRGDQPANVVHVGPLLPHRKPASGPLRHLEKVRAHPSVIVVSQGTVDNDDPGKLIVPALDALQNTRHLVVATTGGKHTADLRRRYPAQNIVIEDHIDFDELFAHTDLFICNGGFGSVLLALCHGVPILAAGRREGKNDINARLAYRGLGVDLRTERPSPKRIARGAARILADERIRRNVANLREELESHRPFDIIDRYLATTATTRTSS